MNKIYHFRALITKVSCALIVVCFFLPWITAHSDAAAAIKGFFGKDDSAIIFKTSGAGIPKIANGPEAKQFIKVAGMIFGDVKNADVKSYLVWLIPLLALIIFVVSTKFKGQWIASAAIGAISTILSVGATFKIMLSDLDAILIRVQINTGLWLIFLAYFALGVVHLVSAYLERKQATLPVAPN